MRATADADDSATTRRDADAAGQPLRIGVMRLARRLRLERDGDDLTFNQLAVLGTLDRSARCPSASWPRHEKVKPPSMTRTVACLEEAGLVDPPAARTDGRQVVVELTDAARDVLDDDRAPPRRLAGPAPRRRSTPDERRAAPRASRPLLERHRARSHEVRRSPPCGVRNYRLFATGSLVSNIGTWMQRVAQDWLVLALTGSAGALGITTGLQFLPIAAVLAVRRRDRRPLPEAHACSTGHPGDRWASPAACSACSPSPASVQLVARLRARVRVRHRPRAFDTPARQAFVNEMVDRDQLRQRRRPQLGVVQPGPHDRPGRSPACSSPCWARASRPPAG